jgi:hypothetical protein
MTNNLAYVGIGLYTIPEAARIIRVNSRTLHNWALGYTFDTKLRRVTQRPVVSRNLGPSSQILTFYELIELLFVKLFRNEGVSLQTIRKATLAAASIFELPYPFATRRFDTDGKRVFTTLEEQSSSLNDLKLVEDLAKGQLAFETVVKPFFRHLEYRGHEEAIRYWPEEGGRRVVLDPERAFGHPIDSITGIPTLTLYQAFRASRANEYAAAAEWHGVPVESVEYAVRYEEALRAAA